MVDPFVVVGKLDLLWTQDGDVFVLNGQGLGDLLANHLGIDRDGPRGIRGIGEVEITIERIGDAQRLEAELW